MPWVGSRNAVLLEVQSSLKHLFRQHADYIECLEDRLVPLHQCHIKSFIMNKAELIDAMAAGANLSKADAKKALDAFVDASTAALKKGDRISLVGFGSFSVSSRKARNGRNPKTGAVIKIAAKKSVRFKAGAELSGKVN